MKGKIPIEERKALWIWDIRCEEPFIKRYYKGPFVPYEAPWGADVALEAEYLRRKKKNPKLTINQFLKAFSKVGLPHVYED